MPESAPMPGRAHMPLPLPLQQQCLQLLRCSCRSRPRSPWEAGASAGRGKTVGCSGESPQCTRGDAQLPDVRVCNTDTQTGMHTATASGPGLPRRATWGGFGCVVTGALLAGHRAWRKDDLPRVAVALARAAGEVVWVAGSQAEGDGRQLLGGGPAEGLGCRSTQQVVSGSAVSGRQRPQHSHANSCPHSLSQSMLTWRPP